MCNFLKFSVIALIVLFMFSVFISCETGETGETRVIKSKELQTRAGLAYAINEQEPYSGKVVDPGSFMVNQKWEEMYKNGRLHGISIAWHVHPNGGTKALERIYKNGKLNGISTIWYKNGQKECEATWKDGKYEGVFKTWAKNGQKKEELIYKNDKLIN